MVLNRCLSNIDPHQIGIDSIVLLLKLIEINIRSICAAWNVRAIFQVGLRHWSEGVGQWIHQDTPGYTLRFGPCTPCNTSMKHFMMPLCMVFLTMWCFHARNLFFIGHTIRHDAVAGVTVFHRWIKVYPISSVSYTWWSVLGRGGLIQCESKADLTHRNVQCLVIEFYLFIYFFLIFNQIFQYKFENEEKGEIEMNGGSWGKSGRMVMARRDKVGEGNTRLNKEAITSLD